jgi:hypothetical protein
MAKEVEASEKPGDFDWAFDMVAGKKKGKTPDSCEPKGPPVIVIQR